MSNSVLADLKGVQLSGLSNVVHSSTAGWQVSILMNKTKGALNGVQFGLVNKNSKMAGKRADPGNKGNSLQFGLINFSK